MVSKSIDIRVNGDNKNFIESLAKAKAALKDFSESSQSAIAKTKSELDRLKASQAETKRNIEALQKIDLRRLKSDQMLDRSALVVDQKEASQAIAREFQNQQQAITRQFQAEQQTQERSFQAKIQALKDAGAQRRREVELALSQQISDRLNQQAESFKLAAESASQAGKLAAAETTKERLALKKEFQELAKQREAIADLDLANKIFDPSELVAQAEKIAGVRHIKSEEDARKVQEIIGQIEAEQRRQQTEADKAAKVALSQELQALDRAYKAEVEARTIAFEQAQQAAKRQFQAEEQQREVDFEAEANQRKLQDLQERAQQRLNQEIELEAFKSAQEETRGQVRAELERQLQVAKEASENQINTGLKTAATDAKNSLVGGAEKIIAATNALNQAGTTIKEAIARLQAANLAERERTPNQQPQRAEFLGASTTQEPPQKSPTLSPSSRKENA
ncbi:hypothetical protein FEK30_00115 (plasmid) [Picosynechococcus sp. PCC 11901]|uniref:hypothetical protein n=1 Tax=Picosynechococcus sp. PCC 11901 TaxID=2579791 RepID=UPI0010FC08A4|nr:hypothetical protein [Picosynechococcus sp. PCC 11901]QCS47976.1 hypothetical protein FEK30_00115 [Picosynechococcus sp. PCC 11901]